MAYKRGDPLVDRNPLFLAASKAVSWIVIVLGWILVKLLYGFRVEGRENLKAAAGKPTIFVSNHVIPLDPLLQACAIAPRITYFTLLEETVLTPVLGTLVRLLGGIPIPADPARLGEVDEGIATALRRRGRVHFYPEGECFLYNQELKPFKAGAFYYAIRHGASIVPILTVLKARERRLRAPAQYRARGDEYRAPGRVRMEIQILPPVIPPAPAGRAHADLHAALGLARSVREDMQAHIDQAGGDKSLYRGPMPRIRGVNDKER